jgi:hypothetical protein
MQYYADSPPTISQLKIEPHFSNLTSKEKLYAHFISKAAHLGTRVTLRQVSAESEALFDIAVELYKSIDGDFSKLVKETGVDEKEAELFWEYTAGILGNLGNYKVWESSCLDSFFFLFGDADGQSRVSETRSLSRVARQNRLKSSSITAQRQRHTTILSKSRFTQSLLLNPPCSVSQTRATLQPTILTPPPSPRRRYGS